MKQALPIVTVITILFFAIPVSVFAANKDAGNQYPADSITIIVPTIPETVPGALPTPEPTANPQPTQTAPTPTETSRDYQPQIYEPEVYTYQPIMPPGVVGKAKGDSAFKDYYSVTEVYEVTASPPTATQEPTPLPATWVTKAQPKRQTIQPQPVTPVTRASQLITPPSTDRPDRLFGNYYTTRGLSDETTTMLLSLSFLLSLTGIFLLWPYIFSPYPLRRLDKRNPGTQPYSSLAP